MRFREDLPARLPGPRGGGVGGGVDVAEAPAADLERHKDVQEPDRHGHPDAEVARPERGGVVPDERRPALPPGAGGFASPAPRGAQLAVDRARRSADPALHEERRGDPLLTPGRVVSGHGGHHLLERGRKPRPARP